MIIFEKPPKNWTMIFINKFLAWCYTVFTHSFVIQLRFKSGIHKSELKKMNYVFSVCTTQATTEHEDSLHRGVILENNI